MHQQGGTIKGALDSIAFNEYVLPAIQREFVWRPEQVCALFDSVMQGYPFGEFLFWRIAPENSKDYRWYGFMRDYHQRNNRHCPDLGIFVDRPLTAVLDGQQRLTAFNIGLRGSMAVKLPRLHWNNHLAFPTRVLALDLLDPPNPDEFGNRYTFDFIDPDRVGLDGHRLWFRVSDVLSMENGPPMLRWLLDKGLDNQQLDVAFGALNRLHHVVHVEPMVAYYEERNQDIEHVLNIFIRCNSGGTVLSYSDLLLSIAVSQWTELDARDEVHGLVDELNQIKDGLTFNKNFVLKAGLMLSDISSVGFRVENFTHDNMAVLESNWPRIKAALLATATLMRKFHFDSRIIRADSALLPIAYYLYRQGVPGGFNTGVGYAADRRAIWGWLTRSILKGSGIWGYGVDPLLTALRDVIRNAPDNRFPVAEMCRVMAQRGKRLDFSSEEVEDLADMSISDRRIFPLLALLSPFIDLDNHQFHIDHIFPRSRFSQAQLRDAGVSDDQRDDFADCVNRIANLQLLDGITNMEKQAALPADWIAKHFKSDQARQQYRDRYLLGEIPEQITGFMDFYEARRERLQERITQLVNTV